MTLSPCHLVTEHWYLIVSQGSSASRTSIWRNVAPPCSRFCPSGRLPSVLCALCALRACAANAFRPVASFQSECGVAARRQFPGVPDTGTAASAVQTSGRSDLFMHIHVTISGRHRRQDNRLVGALAGESKRQTDRTFAGLNERGTWCLTRALVHIRRGQHATAK